jgi:hypothetical protein
MNAQTSANDMKRGINMHQLHVSNCAAVILACFTKITVTQKTKKNSIETPNSVGDLTQMLRALPCLVNFFIFHMSFCLALNSLLRLLYTKKVS